MQLHLYKMNSCRSLKRSFSDEPQVNELPLYFFPHLFPKTVEVYLGISIAKIFYRPEAARYSSCQSTKVLDRSRKLKILITVTHFFPFAAFLLF